MSKFINNSHFVNQRTRAAFPLFASKHFLEWEKKAVLCRALENQWNVSAFDAPRVSKQKSDGWLAYDMLL